MGVIFSLSTGMLFNQRGASAPATGRDEMHKYKITLYEHYEIEAETEAEAKAFAVEDFARKYNLDLTRATRSTIPQIKVTAKLEAFDNL